MKNITDEEFRLLADYIKANFGINLSEQKKNLLVNRLYKLVASLNLNSITDYYEYLLNEKSGKAKIELVNNITTNHTFFMREISHFKFFANEVLPYISKNIRDYDLRIWTAACSTGEEAYTLAMIIDDFFSEDALRWNKKILATDISEKALNCAKKGQYSANEIAGLPSSWKLNKMKEVEKNIYQIKEEIRSEIIFRKFNLMTDIFPFKKNFQTIFCRNVMIYFDYETRKNLVKKFYKALEPGGYLFVGHAETIERGNSGFKYVMPSVYRKE